MRSIDRIRARIEKIDKLMLELSRLEGEGKGESLAEQENTTATNETFDKTKNS